MFFIELAPVSFIDFRFISGSLPKTLGFIANQLRGLEMAAVKLRKILSVALTLWKYYLEMFKYG